LGCKRGKGLLFYQSRFVVIIEKESEKIKCREKAGKYYLKKKLVKLFYFTFE
jgi:hypothetical protein